MFYRPLLAACGVGATATVALLKTKTSTLHRYTYKDVENHTTPEGGVWVTYKDGVYDISQFIHAHPGGQDKIMLAAGRPLEPFWDMYRQHTNNPAIIDEILEPMKIGVLSDYDPGKHSPASPYINDPVRTPNPTQKCHTIAPFNSETDVVTLRDSWITPTEDIYVRNHHPVPDISIEKSPFSLAIHNHQTGVSHKFTLQQLKNMPHRSVISTMQCGGNRRGELSAIRPTSGMSWGCGAISNSKWTGVPLRQLLLKSGLSDEDVLNGGTRHVHLESVDGLKVSIPAEKAMDPFGDVLVAYELNDEAIPRDHGHPLRAVVPGYVGVKNVKWLKGITVSDKEADGGWQKGIAYKPLPHYVPDVPTWQGSLEQIPAITEPPVQSFITDVVHQGNKKDARSIIRGIAYSGGGRSIVRVDVSCDGGNTFQEASLKEGGDQQSPRAWAWVFWDLETTVPAGAKVVCKAVDSSYNCQPKQIEHAWNVRGLNNNSWHCVDLPS